jgi:hypothetical protein
LKPIIYSVGQLRHEEPTTTTTHRLQVLRLQPVKLGVKAH